MIHIREVSKSILNITFVIPKEGVDPKLFVQEASRLIKNEDCESKQVRIDGWNEGGYKRGPSWPYNILVIAAIKANATAIAVWEKEYKSPTHKGKGYVVVYGFDANALKGNHFIPEIP